MRSTLLVSAATTASRFLGLIREQLFAALLGAGYFADAFVVAFRIPNLLRDLFAEGALSAAFIPTFAKVEKEQGPEAAHAVANRVVGAILMVVGLLTLLGVLFADQIVWALASGFFDEPGKAELTAKLARIMMPFLPALSLAAVMMGMLNARRVFAVPALAPALFNLSAIAVGVFLKLAGYPARTAVVGWSIGTLVGGFAQFAVQLPALRRQGYRLRPIFGGLWRDPSLRRIARLMAPATLGLAATEANIFINTQFASTQPGANAWLNYAFRLMYLPIGIFGVAIATVTTSTLARKAAEKDFAGLKAGLSQGLRHVAFLAIPSTVGLVVLAEPIIRLVYQYGRFTPQDTQATAVALAAYSVGLYAYSGVKVAAPAFYALDRARVPLFGSAAAVLTNLALNLAFFRYLGYVGLALGISLGAMVNLLILTTVFRRATREHAAPKGLFAQMVKVALASVLMGAAVWAALQGMDAWIGSMAISAEAVPVRIVRALGGVAIGGIVYAVACRVLRVGEMDEVLAAVRRRRRRAAPASA
ncbi:MAG TPA: murein biosynthesis integral membrane protein MurJ [Myxococcales bacterium]|jgi:putative peptidoglycan lipid II flippase|nr:murein biosynthesis integral membrane protein MurJ [Myxococcales bacterium]